jgi:hypothetical protein
MALNEQESLDEIRESTMRLLEPHIQDKKLLKLVVTHSLTAAVIETKRLCEGAIMGCEKKMGDNIAILEAVELVVPTTSVSTELLT